LTKRIEQVASQYGFSEATRKVCAHSRQRAFSMVSSSGLREASALLKPM